MKKRVLSLTLAVLLLVSLVPFGVIAEGGSSWTDDNGITYTLENGTLTVSGTGECRGLLESDFDVYEATELVIEDGITGIGEWAFSSCDSLTSISIPNSVTTIGDGAFYDCGSLMSVSIPDSVTTIGNCAFWYCSALTQINVSGENASYSSIDGVLYNKAQTTLVQFPCGKSGDFSVPDGVTSIDDCAFWGCTALTSIAIPGSMTDICAGAFEGCSALTQINVSGENASYSSIDGVLYNKAQTTLVQFPCGKSGSFTVPDGVTTIGDSAFRFCESLMSVSIPDSVTTIGDSAFSSCESLTSVSIPDSVTTIGDSAFSSCESLTSVSIPDSVTTIGDSAFYGCSSLTGISIPSSVTSIGVDAFGYCKLLAQIDVSGENASYSSIDGVLYNKAQTTLVQCPGGKSGSFTVPNGVMSIGGGAFYSCFSLTSITIPSTVTHIDDYAFSGCSSLTDVYYSGTQEQWNKISIADRGNECLTNATIHYGNETHTHSYTDTVTAPTCTEQGYTTHSCSCGESYVDSYVAALGHDYKDGKCTVCGAADPDYSEPTPEVLPGDINGDGKVDLLDLIRLKKFLAGVNVELVGSADVNGDGKVDLLDLIRLKKFIAGENVELVGTAVSAPL